MEEVEVILGQVREGAHLEVHAAEPVHGHGVRRDLHHHRVAARVGHLPQHALKLDRVGRGLVGGHLGRADHTAHGADQAGLHARGLKYGLDQEGGRGLALRAGDAEQAHRAGGIAEKALRDQGQRLAHVLHQHLRAVQLQEPLHNQRAGALFHHLRREFMGVPGQTLYAEKERTPFRLSGVGTQRVDFDVHVAARLAIPAERLNQFTQFHG